MDTICVTEKGEATEWKGFLICKENGENRLNSFKRFWCIGSEIFVTTNITDGGTYRKNFLMDVEEEIKRKRGKSSHAHFCFLLRKTSDESQSALFNLQHSAQLGIMLREYYVCLIQLVTRNINI